jgi:hypothetical protein
MKHVLPVLVASIVFGCGAAAASGGEAAPTHRRIVMHGVDCLIENGSVCPEERPVLDEALSEVDPTAQVVVRTEVRSGLPTSGDSETLPTASVDAICEYLSDGGIDALSVGGEMVVRDLDNSLPRTDVQLSHTAR